MLFRSYTLSDMYPVTFPAVLIDLQEASWSNLEGKSQKGTVKVNVQLLIDCYDDTHYNSGTMDAIKERSAMVEELHRLLQGYRLKEDGRSKGMGTEWDQEVVGNVDPQKRVLCLAQGFLRG